jgi:hypothetical protein
LLSFYFLNLSTGKTFLLRDFQKIIFVVALLLTKSGKNLAEKVPHLKFIVLKNYLAAINENFISVSRVYAGKKKPACQNIDWLQPFQKS